MYELYEYNKVLEKEILVTSGMQNQQSMPPQYSQCHQCTLLPLVEYTYANNENVYLMTNPLIAILQTCFAKSKTGGSLCCHSQSLTYNTGMRPNMWMTLIGVLDSAIMLWDSKVAKKNQGIYIQALHMYTACRAWHTACACLTAIQKFDTNIDL